MASQTKVGHPHNYTKESLKKTTTNHKPKKKPRSTPWLALKNKNPHLEVQRTVPVLVKVGEDLFRHFLTHLGGPELVDVHATEDLREKLQSGVFCWKPCNSSGSGGSHLFVLQVLAVFNSFSPHQGMLHQPDWRSTINPPAWSPLWLSFHHRPAKVKSARSCFMLLSHRSSFTVGKSESLALLSCQFLHPTQVGLSIQRNGRSHQDYGTREHGTVSAVSNNKHWCIPSSNRPFVSCTSKALKAAHNTSSWQRHTFPLTPWYSQAWMEHETFHPIQSTSSSQSKDKGLLAQLEWMNFSKEREYVPQHGSLQQIHDVAWPWDHR